MNKTKKKTIFFPIEIKSREFIPKCLLSYELIEKDFRIYIGTKNTIDRAVKNVKSGIFFHKSTHMFRSEYYKSLGLVFVFLDEEGGVTIPRSKLKEFCNKRYSTVNTKKNDLVFLPSRNYKEIVSKLPDIKGVELFISGWPRIDLWREEFKSIYNPEIETIHRKYGNYYLFITSFGMSSEITFKERIRTSTDDFEVSYRTHKYHAFKEYVRLIRELSKLLNQDEQIIVRPHPSESIDDWNKIIKGLKNVKIVREGDVTPWILGTEALIQFGSTIAVQAALNSIPSVQYKIVKKEGITDTSVFELSYDAKTPEEVYSMIKKYKNKKDNRIRKKTEMLLRNEMAYDKKELASKKIADKLNLIPVNKINKPKLSIIDKIQPWCVILYNKIILAYRKLFKISTLERVQIEKVEGGINKEEVIGHLNKISNISKNRYDFKVEQVCKNLICIERCDKK